MNDMLQFFRQMSGKLSSNIYAGVQGQNNLHTISFLRQLQKEMKKNNSLEIPLHELEVVVFDLETTGFYPEKEDRIISIGAIKMAGPELNEQETFYSLVQSDLPLSDEIVTLTNIQSADLLKAPPASEVLVQFLQFIKSHVLVAHHAKHEQSFMQKMTWDLLRTRFEHRIIDTSFLTRLSNPILKSMSLEEVCNDCGIEIKNRHHALGDAILTGKVWSYHLKQAQIMGFQNLREVYEYIAKLK